LKKEILVSLKVFPSFEEKMTKKLGRRKNEENYDKSLKFRDDGFSLKPKALFSWLTRVLYNRRYRVYYMD